MSDIKSLNPMDFTKVLPTRNQIIDGEEAKKLPPLMSHKANQIARDLHPSFQSLVVKDIITETADTKTFVLGPDASEGTEKLAYPQAGQYIAVSVKIGENTFTRPISLSSSPLEAKEGTYRITVKKAQKGIVSTYLLSKLKVGDKLKTSAPLGNFTFEPLRDARHVIGVAGGSGITPFRAMAKAIMDGTEDFDLTLLYGSKTREDAIFFDELKQIERKCSKFRVINVFSEEEKAGFEHGFITKELILKYKERYNPHGEYSIFACGPSAMYDFLGKQIEEIGLRKKFVRFELFSSVYDLKKNPEYEAPSKEMFKVTVRICGEDTVIDASPEDTLLVSMEKNGIIAPNDCRSGSCGFCHSELIKGVVFVPDELDGTRLADKKYGYIHPCVTYPFSDLIIDVPPMK